MKSKAHHNQQNNFIIEVNIIYLYKKWVKFIGSLRSKNRIIFNVLIKYIKNNSIFYL